MNTKKPITIAMVDGDVMVRKGLVDLINRFPKFSVTYHTSDGGELIDWVDRAGILPDICIVSTGLPFMNAFQLVSELRQKSDEVKILVLSALDKEYTIVKMIKSGANGYIRKSQEPRKLMEALISVYLRSYVPSEQVFHCMANAISKKGLGCAIDISNREMEFLSLCGSRLTYKEIGAKMFVSPRTVEGYRDRLFDKINVRSRQELALFAISIGAAAQVLPGDTDEEK